MFPAELQQRLSQLMVDILNSAAKDKLRAPGCRLCAGHELMLSAKTKNVLHVVLSHSILFVVVNVHHHQNDKEHKSTYYGETYDVRDVVGWVKKEKQSIMSRININNHI